MQIPSSKILLLDEIQVILQHLEAKQESSINAWVNKIVFRLSCCCGLRVSELCGLVMDDLVLGGPRPNIRIRPDNTKRHCGKGKGREVPLWWDKGTLEDLQQWAEHRWQQGAKGSDPLVCSQTRGPISYKAGKPLNRVLAARRWKTALKVLGPHRQNYISVHCGRHSFCSHALSAGRSVLEVQHAAGHCNAAMTLGTYSHLIEKFDLPDVFVGA